MNVLVMGLSKTGTTVISKTIANSIPNSDYVVEPKEIIFFEKLKYEQSSKPVVVKVIFEHWNSKPRMRNAVLYNEARLKFDKRICIIRDPRDEMISRLYYLIKPYFDSKVEYYKENQAEKEQAIEKWISIFREKEADPRKISILSMCKRLMEEFKVVVLPKNILNTEYSDFISNHTVLFRLSYEDFIQGNTQELEKYLGIPLRTVKNMGTHEYTRRSEGMNNWKKYFTEEDVIYFKQYFSNLAGVYSLNDWELSSDKQIDPKHGSEYLQRLMANPVAEKKSKLRFW
ncbi:MAG: hypothetical protein OEW39_03590 [Deltaproteobacteria bacterium]|nr:hypothetical protein [Deltaproteobacteria bacterium]